MDNNDEDRTPDGFWKIEAYTDGTKIMVMGWPTELPEGHPHYHSCDQMGCGTFDHVIAIIPLVREVEIREQETGLKKEPAIYEDTTKACPKCHNTLFLKEDYYCSNCVPR